MSQVELLFLSFDGLTLHLLGGAVARLCVICYGETLIQTFARILRRALLAAQSQLVCVHDCA